MKALEFLETSDFKLAACGQSVRAGVFDFKLKPPPGGASNLQFCTSAINVSILKTLAEQELPYANIVELNKVTSKVIGGSTENIDANEPRIPCILGGTKYTGLCDDSLSINIIPYSVYREIQENLEYSKMEEVSMTILPLKRTTIVPKGIVRDVQVIVNNSIFPVDFVVVDVPKHPFCPIIFGKPFHMSTNLKIDNKRGIVALKLGEEEFQFNFSKFKDQSYEK